MDECLHLWLMICAGYSIICLFVSFAIEPTAPVFVSSQHVGPAVVSLTNIIPGIQNDFLF